MEPQCDGGPEAAQVKLGGATEVPPPLEANAPSHSVVPADNQPTVNTSSRRTSSSTDSNPSKPTVRYNTTAERITQLRKVVDDAIRERKTYTIRGGWNTIRTALLHRGWVEKYENAKQKVGIMDINELCNNLPAKQSWETPAAYTEKCEKMIMSRLMHLHEVDFYWNMRRDQSEWHHRVNTYQIMNRFSRSFFTSKEGLCLLLQQMHWFNEPGVAHVNFPRCYVLGFPDHYQNFIEDFRLTACANLLKWLVLKYECEDEFAIKSPEGVVPFSALQFALDRSNEYVACQKHLDIDREFSKVWDHEWEQFLQYTYLIVHKNALFLETKEWSLSILNAAAKTLLAEMAKFWPQVTLDGTKNIWIIKPGNKCRGRGIQLIRTIEDVTKIMNLKLKYVVQKYIERPLIIYETKFDIRQWFMVTGAQPLTIWMYKDSYLRFSSQIFSLDNFHESLHLTNHAVQCKYSNVKNRDKNLPPDNMWDNHTFKNYLKQIGQGTKWEEIIYPGMRENIVGSMLACQDTMDRRPNTFELYGADFVIGEDFIPWLLEINSSPDLSCSTSVTSRMCPHCLEDMVKVTVDKRRNPSADTGLFECIYKQNLPRAPAYLGMSLSIRGRKIFKKRSKEFNKESSKKEPTLPYKESSESTTKKPHPFAAAYLQSSELFSKFIPKMLNTNIYKGPVIGDLIEELHKSYYLHKGSGCEFVPAVVPAAGSKKKAEKVKNERVPKSDSVSAKSNKNAFVNRKLKERKNIKTADANGVKQKNRKIVKSAYFGLFHEWKFKNDTAQQKDADVWEKETISILKDKAILSKFSNFSQNVDDAVFETINKNSAKNSNSFPCVNQDQMNLYTVGKKINQFKPLSLPNMQNCPGKNLPNAKN